jgi:5'-deoxynucleotidase YfbR-like HD superfamily hydrolase
MMKHTLEFIQAGADVKRFHTKLTLQSETVGHHSHGVAMMCLLLDPFLRRQVLIAALVHDLAEHITGDIPSPAKRQYGIGEQVNALEEDLLRAADLASPKLHPDEERTLKLADIYQGMLFCAREISLGNIQMREVFNNYVGYAETMVPVDRELELLNIIKGQVK